jgi:hypothetical protein
LGCVSGPRFILRRMGLLLIVAGLLLWLLGGYFVVGVILIVLGVVLFFSWDGGYGYGHWRRGP